MQESFFDQTKDTLENGFIEDQLLILPIETFNLFLESDYPADICALYLFYCYTAKWQNTKQPKATDGFVRQGLGMGKDRLIRAQKYLIEKGFIERISRRDTLGMISGHYIKINYYFKEHKFGRVLKESTFLQSTVDPKGMLYNFQGLKDKGLNVNIYERDKYICSYCGNKVENIQILYDKGLSKAEIGKYVSENKGKVATIDHIIPLSAGGDNAESNLITCCLSCNSKKNVHIAENGIVDKSPQGPLSTSGKSDTNAYNNKYKMLKDNKINVEYSNFALFLKDSILKNNPEAKITETQVKNWSDDVRLMVERDGRELAKMKVVLDWSQNNDFWKANILSMGTFREKYDKLKMQSEQKNKKGSLIERERGLKYEVKKGPVNV